MENIVIIGWGPAGNTAAIYASRANLKPLMFEGFMAGGFAAGGQLTTTTIVENFPGFPKWIDGNELMANMRAQALNAGTRIETKTVDKVDLSTQPFKIFVGNDIIETKSIIIATGAAAKRLSIPGEEKYRQKWISACAVCDGGLPLFRDKVLVVVGGGDVSIEESLHLSHFASKVIILVRKNVLRASQAMQDKIQGNEKIEFMRNTEAIEAVGDEVLTGVKVKNNTTNEEKLIACGWLFYAVGHTPNTEFLAGQVKRDETGYIQTHFQGHHTQTSVPWVFAAGDVADKRYRQAITSASTWCIAVMDAQEYLNTL